MTAIAQEELNLSPATRIVTYNEDARMAGKGAPAGQYDLIVSDVVNEWPCPITSPPRVQPPISSACSTRRNLSGQPSLSGSPKGASCDPLSTRSNALPYVYVLSEAGNYQAAALVGGRPAVPDRTTVIVAAAQQPIDFSRFRSYRTGSEAPTAVWWRQPTERSRWPRPQSASDRRLRARRYHGSRAVHGRREQWDWQLLSPRPGASGYSRAPSRMQRSPKAGSTSRSAGPDAGSGTLTRKRRLCMTSIRSSCLVGTCYARWIGTQARLPAFFCALLTTTSAILIITAVASIRWRSL